MVLNLRVGKRKALPTFPTLDGPSSQQPLDTNSLLNSNQGAFAINMAYQPQQQEFLLFLGCNLDPNHTLYFSPSWKTKQDQKNANKSTRGADSGKFFPARQEGVVRCYVGIRVCDASTPRPHPVSRQSSSPVDPAEYPARAARQWIPPSIPPERLASRSSRVSRQSCSPVDPAEYPARAVIPPSFPPEQPASGSRPVSR